MLFCKECLLPETYPGIRFDEHGVCNICRDYHAKWDNRKPRDDEKSFFTNIVNELKSNQTPVVITLSGGIDSTYVAYLTKKVFGLNVIGANFDHGFVTDTARRNLERISRQLDIPITTVRADNNALYQLYKRFLIATGDFCTPCCQGCCRAGFIVAKNHGINTILHGGVSGSRVEFNALGMLRHHYDRFMKYAGDFTPEQLADVVTHPDEIAQFRLISLPQYLPWNENVIMDTISRELDWTPHPDGSTRHVDCAVAKVSDHLLAKKFGFSKRWMTISANIRAGHVTRENGLHQIIDEEQSVNHEPDELAIFLNTIDVSRREFDCIPFYNAKPAYREIVML